ncbi:hypothetical protein M885DRAFT_508211 [Pelagophyceae sp. CCMP2097]|nr:hypothetical protein M885DRAFT_508211 [Pelagophyceae sp. CCMP2097]
MRLRLLCLGAALRCASAFQSPMSAAVSSRAVASRPLLAVPATDVERAAMSSFKMITEEEATIRKAGGVAIGIATAALFATGVSPTYGSLAGGIFAAVSTYRTGSEYQ